MEYELLHIELKIQSTNKGSSGYSIPQGLLQRISFLTVISAQASYTVLLKEGRVVSTLAANHTGRIL